MMQHKKQNLTQFFPYSFRENSKQYKSEVTTELHIEKNVNSSLFRL